MEDGITAHGQEIWQEFYKQTQKGEEAFATVTYYHTLDRSISSNYAYCEVFEQDYPACMSMSCAMTANSLCSILEMEAIRNPESTSICLNAALFRSHDSAMIRSIGMYMY